ncbi:insulin-degrading enzyme-like 1, peroxisomal isoform X2 [Canna indica]|uniref:Insulin-degrading enzyme-like 1, peroxisomal isoform X2 n=1 Tax=Canna indica TaxID=4628 RepID=A0AAQ3JVL5_9LILI|nr:insulin-degrading enzyme-like 1, peroxisomal isoform X2 [Canna indica]
MAVGASEVEILKPRCDKREYRRIVLPNSLEVLLISDPETDKSAASMNVSVGSFSDPDGLEGLAHFLEHMLFYASEKYPVEDSYSKYITEHGGSTNAYTSSEHTNFHFEVNTDCFEEAVDRFAQFFISPLMSPDATLREIKAVDSENQKNLLADGWRMSQLRKHLSSENHPYHKFSTGNWNTLEVKPKSNGLDTRLELIKFYEKNYSANLMHLVVYAKEGLDAIQSLVERNFSNIPNIGLSYFHIPGQPCSSEHLQILVKAVRIKQGHILRIMWPITPSIQNYKEGPCRYLSHLIGHEGEGSVFFILKQLGWALSLQAGEGDWSFDFSFFSVVIELTDKGHEHIEDIVGLLFKYISLLQESGVNKWIFDELVAISETKFHYKDKISPSDYVVDIASNMQIFPPENWLVGWSLPSKFVPNSIQKILDELTPENIRIFWESKNFEGCTNFVEPWYGTAYSVEKVTTSTIKQWIAKAPNMDLHLPKPNIFIPSDLTIKNVQEKDKFPVLLSKSCFSRLWYKPDTKFCTPKANIKIDFNCPQSVNSPEAEVLSEIYTRLLMDYLNEYAYDAQVAGLYYSIYSTGTGFAVTVGGYNDKMRILLETIIGRIEQFEVKPDRFSVIKESVTKEYQNFKFQQPYKQAWYYCSLLLEDQTWPWSEKLEVLPHLEADHLTKFSTIMLEKTFLEFYIAGNIEPNEAESIVQHIEDVMFKSTHPKCKPLFPSQHLSNRIVKLERGLRYYYPVEVFNAKDENSALIHYIQVHQDDIKMNVRLQLFALIAKQAAFHQLRSIEQLGYITILMQRYDSGVRGVQVIIQSTVKDPSYLESRVDSFLETFASKIHEMTDDEYKNNVNALTDMKLEKHKNLWEESGFYWREIVDGTFKFDRIDSEVAALKELKKEELIDFFDTYIKVDAPQRKALSIQVYGGQNSAEYKKVMEQVDTPKLHRIKDVFNFRRSRPLYGSFKGGLGHGKL